MGEATLAFFPDPPQSMPAVVPPEKTALYVGDLDAEVSEEDLVRSLGNFGTIVSIRVCRDRSSGKSLRYAYVNFSSKLSGNGLVLPIFIAFPILSFSDVSFLASEAENALQMMNHTTLKGKPMRIMWTDRNPIGRKNGVGNLFVKNIDESIGGSKLELLFRPFGRVESCKVQQDEKGRSRGFGFVQMNTEEAAQSAIAALNGTVPNGASKKLYVAKFVRKCEREALNQQPEVFCNLYIKNLEKDITDDLLQEKFSEYGKINSVIIMKDENGNSRGFGFVSFESPDDAKRASDAMNGAKLGSKTIYVGPAQKKAEREITVKKHFGDANGQQQLKKTLGTTVFVRNIEDSVTDEALQEHFASCGKVLWLKASRENDGRSKGYCFVCFNSLEEANKAVAKLNGSKLNGKRLYVAIAQNRDNRFKLSQGQYFVAGDCPPPYCIRQIPDLASPYQPDRLVPHYGNQGFQYLPPPSEQIRNYSRSTNMVPLHRPACHAPFNSPMHPMMVYLPQESYYMQGRYADDYYLHQRYFQPPRYDKGSKKTDQAQFQQPGTSGVKKGCGKIVPRDQQAMLSKFEKLDPKLRKSKIMEALYSNIPKLEHKQASSVVVNTMTQMKSGELHDLLSKPSCLTQLFKEEAAKGFGAEDQAVAASTALQITEN